LFSLIANAATLLLLLAGCSGGVLEPQGPIGAANIQIATCSPNFLILESIQDWGGFHAKILKRPIRFEAGFVIPPGEPGLGVELDEAVALAHPYEDQALHLEPAEQPMDFD